jgi:hypothetical protein
VGTPFSRSSQQTRISGHFGLKCDVPRYYLVSKNPLLVQVEGGLLMPGHSFFNGTQEDGRKVDRHATAGGILGTKQRAVVVPRPGSFDFPVRLNRLLSNKQDDLTNGIPFRLHRLSPFP